MKKAASFFCLLFMIVASLFPQETEIDQVKYKLRVTASWANIRNGPSLQNDIIRVVKAGTTLDALGKSDGWYVVKMPSKDEKLIKKGYIHQSIVEVLETVESQKAPPKIEDKEQPQLIQEEPKTEAMRKAEQKDIPEVPEPSPSLEEPSPKKTYIKADYSMGFSETSAQSSWTETIYHETANTTISYDVNKGNSIRISAGFLFTDSLAVELGGDISSRNMEGSYTSSIPNPLYFDSNRQAQGSGTYDVTENTVFLNFVFVYRFSKFGVDIFAGPAYILSKATVVSETTISDVYPYDSVDVTTKTTEVSKNVFGFNGGASLLFYFSENIALYTQGYYLSGSGSFDTGTDVPGPEIKLGGFKASVGLKFLF